MKRDCPFSSVDLRERLSNLIHPYCSCAAFRSLTMVPCPSREALSLALPAPSAIDATLSQNDPSGKEVLS